MTFPPVQFYFKVCFSSTNLKTFLSSIFIECLAIEHSEKMKQ